MFRNITLGLMVATSFGTQDKSATPVVPFAQILECVKAANCKNMKKSAVSWSDVAGIPVIAFTDDRTGYALRVWPEGDLSIWMTPPGENRPTQRLTLGAEGTVLRGELGWMPGDPPMVGTWSPEETAQYLVRHKTFSSPQRSAGSASDWRRIQDGSGKARRLRRSPPSGANSRM